MAPSKAVRAEREKNVKALLSFADSLQSRLTSGPFDATLATDLQTQINVLPLPASSALNLKRDELDKVGTALWNTSTRLKREENTDGSGKQVLCLLRVFAFLILESAAAGLKAKTEEWDQDAVVRLMKVALKSARVCLDAGMVELCAKAIERAAGLEEALGVGKDRGVDTEVEQANRKLKVEYFILRAALAWRQGRMDIAEHMINNNKSELRSSQLGPATAESLADLLYEIGKDQAKHGRHDLAVKWLERAYDVLGDQDLERLSADAGELRLSIMQSMVQSLMKLKNGSHDSNEQEKAWELVRLLELDYGEKIIVSLLKLDLLSSAETMDGDQYYSVLLRMVGSIVLNEANLKTIMHHVYKLKDQSNLIACKILDELIMTRLLAAGNKDWLEKATITRTWLATKDEDADDLLDGLRGLFDGVMRNTKTAFSAPATHAAQTLLWKRIEIAYTQERYAASEDWCALSVHSLFEKAGESNKAKISRKMMLSAMARKDWEAAREFFNRMSDPGKAEPMSRYILYKVCLRNGDAKLAVECLDLVCQQSTKDATLLYACVLDAQQCGDKRQAVVALQKVLEKYDYGAPTGVNLPALLRCTIRLLVPQLLENGKVNKEIAEELCKVFEGAASQATNSKRRPINPALEHFTPVEFQWFSKNSYNLALKHCTELGPDHLTKILGVCITFIMLLLDHKQGDITDDLNLRLLFCNFLSACAYVVLARAEDNTQVSAQRYLSVRFHANKFLDLLPKHLEKAELSDTAKEDLISKHFQLIKFSLEASLKLSDWESMDALFAKCWIYNDPRHYATLADLILVIQSHMAKTNPSRAPQRKLLNALQTVVNRAYRHDSTGAPAPSGGIANLARWLRCLFQLAMGIDPGLAFNALGQATGIAAKRKGTANPFPALELEWLVATAWNHTVDLYCNDQEEDCNMWADQVIALAETAEDGGTLARTLLGNRVGLTFEEEE